MARAKLTEVREDLITDSGAVLWSFVRGEQLEYPILLSFLSPDQPVDSFTFEAVVVEANNVVDQLDKPLTVRTGGNQVALTVRKQAYLGLWSAATAYSYENVVGLTVEGSLTYYKRLSGAAVVNSVPPNLSPAWEETTLNVVYIQFPGTLGATYQVPPSVGSPSYGFFELRVTEPNNSVLRRTWKPVRGMVELHFSPTDLVPDVP